MFNYFSKQFMSDAAKQYVSDKIKPFKEFVVDKLEYIIPVGIYNKAELEQYTEELHLRRNFSKNSPVLSYRINTVKRVKNMKNLMDPYKTGDLFDESEEKKSERKLTAILERYERLRKEHS